MKDANTIDKRTESMIKNSTQFFKLFMTSKEKTFLVFRINFDNLFF